MEAAKEFVQTIMNTAGFEIRKLQSDPANFPVEFDSADKEIISYVLRNSLTMVSPERLWTTLMACRHAVERNIDGDFVECGVWRGGNAIVAAAVFKARNFKRKIYLYDTFEGMTLPTAEDRIIWNGLAATHDFAFHKEETSASVDEVKRNFADAGLLDDNIVFVPGDVLETLADSRLLPEKISVLRLDTDWCESTKVELEVLYPRLSIGGCLILDDYAHWAGSKKAVDEYFATRKRPFLQYTDKGGRAGVKFD